MYIYRFEICAEQVRCAVDEHDLIYWLISGLNEPCCSNVMPLSLISFDAAKIIAEIMEKHLLEIENKEEIVGITNDDKEISKTNNKYLPIAYCDEILQLNPKSLDIFDKVDINNMDHKTKIVEYEIEIKSELEKVKTDEVENSSDGLWIG
ncbi:hypothetical protein C2G38_2039989 [Gigaspora rosea]|uniref:Uncharacterized protein n=1 Tax=Gigaspora rosea TaxID=44941 RepID=A0A397TUE7_9GLOM|nr:hypothetical protein C2G38_2294787 [Gigaspora rosea]RIB14677.1 hypothetical protein C2G38_2039989 [Gigaspora rosea]